MLDVSGFEVRLRFEGRWSMPISADVLALAFLGFNLNENQQATVATVRSSRQLWQLQMTFAIRSSQHDYSILTFTASS